MLLINQENIHKTNIIFTCITHTCWRRPTDFSCKFIQKFQI